MSKAADETGDANAGLIRYAQCWEDADVLLEALDVQRGDVCLSIASGGENTLSLLSRGPAKVIAVDYSPAQLACLEIKCLAFRRLEHPEMLELLGAHPSGRRLALYERVRSGLSTAARGYWDARRATVAAGIGAAGRFESFFALFRKFVLPLVHNRAETAALFVPRTGAERERFYREVWNNRRWRLLLRLFLSPAVMGRLGRDPAFFRYARGDLPGAILERIRHALTALDPALNPYLHWIVFGRFGKALPHALRPENFEAVRANLDRLEMRLAPLGAVLAGAADASIDRFNLSDVFEYQSEAETRTLFEQIARAGRTGGRLAWWNMMVPRQRPAELAHRLHALDDLGARLLSQNQAAFYGAFHVEGIA